MEMFRDGSGPLFEFLQSLGRDMTDCGKMTPLARFIQIVNSKSPNQLSRWLIVHLNQLSDEDMQLLRDLEPKFHIVHCPRSHHYFGHEAFRYEDLRSLDFNICLGTDSLASNHDLDLFKEMRLFSETHPNTSCREIVEMVTVNPARALRQEKLLGRMQPGSYADLIAVTDSRKDDVFESIVMDCPAVNWSMIGGVAGQS